MTICNCGDPGCLATHGEHIISAEDEAEKERVKAETRHTDFSPTAWPGLGDGKQEEAERTAKKAERALVNWIGDIVQITVEETLQALLDAVDDLVVSQDGEKVRTGDLRDAFKAVRAHSPSLADRILERVASEDDPYGSRHKEEV